MMNLQIGDIVYVKGHNTLVDNLIKLGEQIEDGQGKYSHVCIYIGNGQVAEAQGGRLTGPASFSEYEGNCDIGQINWTQEQQESIYKTAQKYYGLKYDWTEIALIGLADLTGLSFVRPKHHQFICSEYVKQVILEATGVVLCDKTFTTPEDISLYPNQTIICSQ